MFDCRKNLLEISCQGCLTMMNFVETKQKKTWKKET